jgi:hypothetical protein
MAEKKNSAGKPKPGTPASKLRDLDALDAKVKNVKGGAKRSLGRKRTDP